MTNLNKLGVLVLFLTAVGIIGWLYPHEVRFRYEFQKGKPWMHENLVAPFDYPIYKNEKELKREKDSINLSSPPYFIFDEIVGNEKIALFINDFVEQWDEAMTVDSTGSTIDTITENIVFSYLQGLLKECYERPGIIDVPDSLKNQLSDASTVFVRKNSIQEESLLAPFLTKQEAVDKVNRDVLIFLSANYPGDQKMEILIRNLNLPQYLFVNVSYDAATSGEVKELLLGNQSFTRGMVQAGEKIISKGELVTAEKYEVLESLRREYEVTNASPVLLMGQYMLVFAGLFLLFMFLFHFRQDILEHGIKVMFILVLIVLFVSVAKLTVKFQVIHIYIIPFSLLPIIIRTFYDSRLALFVHIITILLAGFLVPNGFEFVLLQIVAGMIAIFSLANVRRRGQLFMAALFIFLAYSFMYFAISVVQEGNLRNILWKNFIWFAGNGMLILAAYPLIYIFEKIFGFLSDVTLMELTDTNHKLLRKLAEKAPGTFQHCLQVANLAEDVMYQIGGNSLLVRAGALYHDIGKMGLPHFFIENQSGGANPHDEMDLEKSAEIITGHVSYGVDLARKHRLPEQIVDFIRTHHGNTKVQYFYRSYLKRFPDNTVDASKFSYKGVPPFSKETAVLMMADSVEAAARSLKLYTEQAINELVDNIINFQMAEKQFDQAAITLKEISVAKEIFKRKLKSIYHNRIEYPR